MTDHTATDPAGSAIDFWTLRRGDELPPIAFTVTAEDARAYLEATGEPPERWTEVVPPLALGAFALGELLRRMPLPPGALHTGQEFDFLAAVAPGTPLEAHVTIAQRSERQAAVIIVFAIELRASGNVVARGRSTLMAQQ